MKFIYSKSDQELLDKWDKYYDEYYKLMLSRIIRDDYDRSCDYTYAINQDPFRIKLFDQLVRVRETVFPVGVELIE